MKKVFAKISFCIVLFALLLALGAIFFVPSQMAYADSTVDVVKAPVSNLEGNATAGKSTVSVYDSENRRFYIPESFYLTNPKSIISGKIYEVKYAGESFYLYEEPVSSQISVADDELLSPDVRLTLKNEEASILSQRTVDETTEYFPTRTITNDFTIKLLGYNEDATKIYVSATFNGESLHGFIAVEDLEAFTVPYQQRAQAERDALLAAKEELNRPGSIPAPNTSLGLRIVIIVGIAIPTVLIVLLLFKPSKDERRYAKNTVRNSRSRDDFDYDDSRSYNRRSSRDDRDYDRDYDRRDRRDYNRDDRDYDRDYDRRRDYDRDYDRDDYRR